MRDQATSFFDYILASQSGSFASLLTSHTVFANRTIAPYYGVTAADTFQFIASDGLAGIIDGDAGSNKLIGSDGANVWSINSANTGNVNGDVFTSIQNLAGGAGADTFKFSSGATISGTVSGGAGTNTLDYSLCSTQVRVNLATGQATSIKSTLWRAWA